LYNTGTADQITILLVLETVRDPRHTALCRLRYQFPTVRGGGFDAAFAKLLWPLVYMTTETSAIDKTTSAMILCHAEANFGPAEPNT